MRSFGELSAWCLAVLVTASAACSSSQVQQPLTGDANPGGGEDTGIDAGIDAPRDGGPGTPIDGGTGTPIDAGVMPDAPPPEPGELAAMCGTEPSTPDQWERCRVKRYCETLVHCSERNLYTDASECIQLFNAVNNGDIGFDAFENKRSVTAGRASLDVAAFTQCLRDFSTGSCNTAATSPSCATRYVGTIADGQPCFSNAECRSPGASCTPRDCGDSCCTGTCTPLPKLGEPCHELVGGCEPGLVCNVGSKRCVVGDAGSQCDDRTACDAGNWCNNGLCAPDLPEGAVCDSPLQCGGETSCVGKFTRNTTPRCLHLTSEGDACDGVCFGNLLCVGANGTVLGACRPLPGLNENCDPSVGCVGRNHRCRSDGNCVQRTGLNMPCKDGECLPGLFCTDQLSPTNPVCRALFADGDMGCTQDAQCQSHICSGSPSAAGQCLPSRSTCP